MPVQANGKPEEEIDFIDSPNSAAKLPEWDYRAAEIAIPRALIGDPESLGCEFLGDNAAFGEMFLEQIPAGSTTDGKTHIRLNLRSGSSNQEESNRGIIIDGNLHEWCETENVGGGRSVSDRRGNAIDVDSLLITSDAKNLYLAYRNKWPVELNWGYSLFIDTDRNPGTGFSFGEIGGDLLLQGREAFRYSGIAGEWSWTHLGTLSSSVTGNAAEISVPRSLFGDIAKFDYVSLGDNNAVGGAEYELVPRAGWEGGSGFLTFEFEMPDTEPKSLNPDLGGEVVMQYAFNGTLEDTTDRHDPLTPMGSPTLQDGFLVFAGLFDTAATSIDNRAITDAGVTALAVDFRIRHDAWLALGVGAAFILDWQAAWDTQMFFVQDGASLPRSRPVTTSVLPLKTR